MICLALGCLFAFVAAPCFFSDESLPLPIRIICDFILFLTGALPFVLYVAVYKNGLFGLSQALPFLSGALTVLFIIARIRRR